MKQPWASDAWRAKFTLLSHLRITEFRLLLQFWNQVDKWIMLKYAHVTRTTTNPQLKCFKKGKAVTIYPKRVITTTRWLIKISYLRLFGLILQGFSLYPSIHNAIVNYTKNLKKHPNVKWNIPSDKLFTAYSFSFKINVFLA